jgi:hypothetical protein
MSIPSRQTIRKSIKALRTLIDGERDDPILFRIAYAVETALRWVTEDTVGWSKPEVDVVEEAAICKRGIGS